MLFVSSCKKEIYDAERLNPERAAKMLAYKNGPKVATINLAKFKSIANLNSLGILKDEFLSKSSSQQKIMSINIPETFAGFQIITDSIKVIKDKDHTMYVFPVKLSSKRTVSFQNLTIDESANGTIAFINTYTPSKKWIEEWKEGKAGKFDGDIAITYIKLQKNFTLNVPSTSNAVTKGKISTTPGAISLAQVCNTTTYYYAIPYSCGSGQHGPSDTGCYLTGGDAAGYVYISSTITTCYDIPEPPVAGGGGTAPTPPGNYNPCDQGVPVPTNTYSYNNPKVASLMVAPPNPCDEVPLPQLPVDPPAPVKDIRNKTEDPCISAVVNALVAANKNIEGKIGEIIKKFDQSKNFNINIYDGATSNGRPGNMFNSTLAGSIFTADVRLQTSYFKGQDGASKESLAAVLIHEVLHGYIKSQNPSLLDTSNVHHNIMVRNYIEPMSNYLIDAFGISRKDAFSLAWNGVIDSDVFTKADTDKLFEYSYTENGTIHSISISISKQEIMNRAVAYNGNANYANEGKKGTKTCPN